VTSEALSVLDRLGKAEGRAIYDPLLNVALEPLRHHPAVEALCSDPRCRRRVAWLALDNRAAYVAATEGRAKPKDRRGGLSDLAQPQPRRNTGLLPWIELAENGLTSVRTVDFKNPAGYPLRLKFVCRCGRDYTTTNTHRLRDLITAIAAGNGRIYL